MEKVLWVAFGGGLGSSARYLASLGSIRVFGPAIPWGTFGVNVLGSLLLGLLLRHMSDVTQDGFRLALTTGFMGGFTTYSTFNYETLRFIESNQYGAAAAYAGGTLLICLAAGALGIFLAGWL